MIDIRQQQSGQPINPCATCPLLNHNGRGLHHDSHVKRLHGLDFREVVLAHELHERPVHTEDNHHLQMLVRQKGVAIVHHQVRGGYYELGDSLSVRGETQKGLGREVLGPPPPPPPPPPSPLLLVLELELVLSTGRGVPNAMPASKWSLVRFSCQKNKRTKKNAEIQRYVLEFN